MKKIMCEQIRFSSLGEGPALDQAEPDKALPLIDSLLLKHREQGYSIAYADVLAVRAAVEVDVRGNAVDKLIDLGSAHYFAKKLQAFAGASSDLDDREIFLQAARFIRRLVLISTGRAVPDDHEDVTLNRSIHRA